MNQMFQRFESDVGVSITDLKKNPAAVVNAARDEAVAILNHNKVVAYVISPAVWEYVQDLHDDAKIVEMLDSLPDEEPVPVTLDDL